MFLGILALIFTFITRIEEAQLSFQQLQYFPSSDDGNSVIFFQRKQILIPTNKIICLCTFCTLNEFIIFFISANFYSYFWSNNQMGKRNKSISIKNQFKKHF